MNQDTMPVIRFIVETYSSAFDRNGNRSHWSRITSTMTGKSYESISDGQRNAAYFVRQATGLYSPAVHDIECEEIPLRQWKAQTKNMAYANPTDTDIRQLEEHT